MSDRGKFLTRTTITLALLLFLAYQMDLGELVAILFSANPILILLATLVHVLSVLLSVFFDIHIDFSPLAKISFIGFFFQSVSALRHRWRLLPCLLSVQAKRPRNVDHTHHHRVRAKCGPLRFAGYRNPFRLPPEHQSGRDTLALCLFSFNHFVSPGESGALSFLDASENQLLFEEQTPAADRGQNGAGLWGIEEASG